MVPESKIAAWLKAGISLYASNPRLVEQCFYDEQLSGEPSAIGADLLEDDTKRWLPNELAEGFVRYAGVTFPVVTNTKTQLSIVGTPSTVDPLGLYELVHPDVVKLTALLTQLQGELLTRPLLVELSYARVPATMPTFTVHLQHDQQEQPYIGESLMTTAANGIASEWVYTDLAWTYAIRIWTQNPLETIWLYHWLSNYIQQSQHTFAAWGWHDVKMTGSDVELDTQFLPEQVYMRAVMLSGTRTDRALTEYAITQITDIDTIPGLHYTRLEG